MASAWSLADWGCPGPHCTIDTEQSPNVGHASQVKSEVIVQAVSARDHARAEEFAKKHGIPDVRDSYQVLLEAFHNRFHPAVHLFRSFINPADVVHVHTDSMVPWLMTANDNIEFNYNLSGGSMMMLGTYNFGMLRIIFNDEPVECLSCDTSIFGDGVHDRCDYDFKAKFRFLNGDIGEATTDAEGSRSVEALRGQGDDQGGKGADATGDSAGFIHAFIWHRIDVKDSYVIRNKDESPDVKKWVESKSPKVYTYKEAGGEFVNLPGEDWWMSYRYQLDEFVNRVKGRQTQH
ncbi:hypothetical protein V1509DRAFT_613191 [Lipomyces kononenkoae]